MIKKLKDFFRKAKIDVSLFPKFNFRGNFKGLIVGVGAGIIHRDKRRRSNLEGMCIGFGSYIQGTVNGINAAVSEPTSINLNGASFGLIGSEVYGTLNGFSYGTFRNKAKRNGRIAIQVSFGYNEITEYNPDGVVIQVGAYCKAGDKETAIFNIRGIFGE